MAYDVFYYDRRGRQLPEMDREVADYDTPRRNTMLRTSREYAEAVQVDHPHRPCWHWNGRRWVDGAFNAGEVMA